MTSNYTLIDNNFIQFLYEMGGPQSWDLLLNGNSTIIVTKPILREINSSIHKADFVDWLEVNASRITHVDIQMTDVNAYWLSKNPSYKPQIPVLPIRVWPR